MREYKVYAISEGTAIDHIPKGMGIKIVELLGLQDKGITTIGLNFESHKMGLKDIVKIENKKLTSQEFSKIALIAPNATVNIIHGAGVVEKVPLTLPNIVENFVACPNPVCITNAEYVPRKFRVQKRLDVELTCHYCGTVTAVKKMRIL